MADNTSNTTKNKRNERIQSLSFLGVAAGIVVALNIVGVFMFERLDCTANRSYSLSEGSRNVAESLTDKMQITAYFTEDLPPPFNATERYVRDILTEYDAFSKNLEVRFVNPDTEEEEKEAEENGIRAVEHQVLEDDAVSVKKGYRGLVIKYLGEEKTLPVIQDTSGLEYSITQKMKELTGDKKPVGIVANGENGPTLAKGLANLRQVLPTYELKEIDAEQPIDEELAALLIINPGAEISETALRNIDAFVMKGGNLGVFGGGIKLNLEGMAPTAAPVTSGLDKLLKPWGVEIRSAIVADAQCGRAPMRGPLGLTVAVPYPPVPIVTFDEEQQEHPALFRISSAHLPFVSPLKRTKPDDKEIELTTLAASSDKSWIMDGGESIALEPRNPQEWQMTGDRGPFPLVLAIEGKLPSAFVGNVSTEGAAGPAGPARATEKVRVLVSGSGSLFTDQFLNPQQAQGSGALAFALNSIDWLAQDGDLIAIRAKNIEDPMLEIPNAVAEANEAIQDAEKEAVAAAQMGDQATTQAKVGEREVAIDKLKAAESEWDARKNLFKWGSTLGLPFVFAGFGLIRWRVRLAKKRTLSL